MYIDDWLIAANSRCRCLSDTQVVINETHSLGWVINVEKSNLVPTQTPTFLGALLDLRVGMAYPTEERRLVLIQGLSISPNNSQLQPELMVSSFGVHSQLSGPCTLLQAQNAPSGLFPSGVSSISHTGSSDARDHASSLMVVETRIVPRESAFPPPHPPGNHSNDGCLTSRLGGVHWRGFGLRPTAPPLDPFSHNQTGARGSYQGPRPFLSPGPGSESSDQVGQYDCGGLHQQARGNPLLPLVATVVWAIRFGVSLQAVHLPGIDNTRADLLSRQWSRHHSFEWQLHPSVFLQLQNRCQVCFRK